MQHSAASNQGSAKAAAPLQATGRTQALMDRQSWARSQLAAGPLADEGRIKIIPTTDLIAPRLAEFATACGGTLARAHARTGDPVAIDSYIGKGPKFTAEISRFADRYADQNERDHAQLVKAIAADTVQSLPT